MGGARCGSPFGLRSIRQQLPILAPLVSKLQLSNPLKGRILYLHQSHQSLFSTMLDVNGTVVEYLTLSLLRIVPDSMQYSVWCINSALSCAY